MTKRMYVKLNKITENTKPESIGHHQIHKIQFALLETNIQERWSFSLLRDQQPWPEKVTSFYSCLYVERI